MRANTLKSRLASVVKILTVSAFAATVSSCGGGGGSSPLSKADYVKAGNAICASADAKIKAITTPQPTGTDLAAWKNYLDQLIPIVQDEGARLKAVTPPRADKATIDSLLALVATATEQAKNARSAASAGDSTAFGTAINAVASASSEADQISNSYGLNVCGQPN